MQRKHKLIDIILVPFSIHNFLYILFFIYFACKTVFRFVQVVCFFIRPQKHVIPRKKYPEKRLGQHITEPSTFAPDGGVRRIAKFRLLAKTTRCYRGYHNFEWPVATSAFIYYIIVYIYNFFDAIYYVRSSLSRAVEKRDGGIATSASVIISNNKIVCSRSLLEWPPTCRQM